MPKTDLPAGMETAEGERHTNAMAVNHYLNKIDELLKDITKAKKEILKHLDKERKYRDG